MMKLKFLATLLCLWVPIAHANDAAFPAPEPVKQGDSWTYKKTVKGVNPSRVMVNYKITSKNGDKLHYQVLVSDPLARGAAKWTEGGDIDADACLIDFGAGGTLGLQKTCAMDFPQGMDWDTEQTVRGVLTKQRYQVVDTESVTVPAGTFDTTKITANWQMAKPTGAGVAAPKGKAGQYGPTERYRFTYWYSAATKAMVKVVREFYNDIGTVESTVTEELDSYRSPGR
jgi:hypothetical protein